MAKVHISSDIIKPFSGEGDVVAWLKKVRLVAKLQNVNATGANAKHTRQKTAGSVERVATNVERMATGLKTVQETRQGTRHQCQPSPQRRFEYDAPSGKYLRQRDAVFGTS